MLVQWRRSIKCVTTFPFLTRLHLASLPHRIILQMGSRTGYWHPIHDLWSFERQMCKGKHDSCVHNLLCRLHPLLSPYWGSRTEHFLSFPMSSHECDLWLLVGVTADVEGAGRALWSVSSAFFLQDSLKLQQDLPAKLPGWTLSPRQCADPENLSPACRSSRVLSFCLFLFWRRLCSDLMNIMFIYRMTEGMKLAVYQLSKMKLTSKLLDRFSSKI